MTEPLLKEYKAYSSQDLFYLQNRISKDFSFTYSAENPEQAALMEAESHVWEQGLIEEINGPSDSLYIFVAVENPEQNKLITYKISVSVTLKSDISSWEERQLFVSQETAKHTQAPVDAEKPPMTDDELLLWLTTTFGQPSSGSDMLSSVADDIWSTPIGRVGFDRLRGLNNPRGFESHTLLYRQVV